MQLSLIDPRESPTATAEMLADRDLHDAIRFMRAGADGAWPYVERLLDVQGRPAWAVDDNGNRYVVIRSLVFRQQDLDFADVEIRMSARAVFATLDAFQEERVA